jgi:hypothetical protein
MHERTSHFLRACSAVLTVCISIVEVTYANPVRADEASRLIGRTTGGLLADAAESAFEAARTGAEFTVEIRELRRRFWESYPNRPERAEREAAFEHALAEKDYFFLVTSVPEGRRGPRVMLIDALVRVDDGIWPPARRAFEEWIEAIRANLGVTRPDQMVVPTLTTFIRALAATTEERDAYLRARNWAEFDAAGRVPEWVRTPQDYVRMLMLRYERRSPKEATEELERLIAVAGARAVEQAAARVQAAAGPRRVDLIDLGDGGGRDEPHRAFRRVLLTSTDNPRLYILDQLAVELGRQNMPTVQALLERAVLAYGSDAVDRAARTVRAAPSKPDDLKYKYDYPDLSTEWVGESSLNSVKRAVAFQDLLARDDPRGYVRMMLAMNRELDDRDAIEAAYRGLAARHGEDALVAAARKTYMFWGSPHVADGYRPVQMSRRADKELNVLTAVLQGTEVARGPNEDELPVANPLYDLWGRFGPAATVVYRSESAKADEHFELHHRITALGTEQVELALEELRFRRGEQVSKRESSRAFPRTLPRQQLRVAESNQLDYAAAAALRAGGGTSEILRLGARDVTCSRHEIELGPATYNVWVSAKIPGGRCRIEGEYLKQRVVAFDTDGTAGRPVEAAPVAPALSGEAVPPPAAPAPAARPTQREPARDHRRVPALPRARSAVDLRTEASGLLSQGRACEAIRVLGGCRDDRRCKAMEELARETCPNGPRDTR